MKTTKSAKHANDINTFVNQQYGYIGKQLSESLVQYESSELTLLYEESRKIVLEKLQGINQLRERLLDTYAILIMSANLLSEMKLLIDMDEILNILVNSYSETITSVDPVEDAYFIILNHIANKEFTEVILSITLYTFFSRMFELCSIL